MHLNVENLSLESNFRKVIDWLPLNRNNVHHKGICEKLKAYMQQHVDTPTQLVYDVIFIFDSCVFRTDFIYKQHLGANSNTLIMTDYIFLSFKGMFIVDVFLNYFKN